MQKSRTFLVILFVLGTFVSGCGKFYKLQRSDDWQEQYKAAMEYYEDEAYNKATILFEIIRPLARGSAESEYIEFYYAYANYYQRQYILSSHYFKTFYDTYRRSKFAEEALYMHAKSEYEQSPNANLDQTPTKVAIGAFQNFLNRFPESQRRAEASEYINELQQKLEVKAFANAKQYYTLERYEAAVIALENFAKDYPDSKYREEASYLRFLSQYEFAQKSVTRKQEERYKSAATLYLKFIDRYPGSEFARKAEEQYESILEALENLKEQANS